MTRRRLICLALVLLMAVYVASFASWWLGSPAHVVTLHGKRVRFVELHMTVFRWKTIYLWLPGIMFMERVCGYRPVEEIAAAQDSVYVYAR